MTPRERLSETSVSEPSEKKMHDDEAAEDAGLVRAIKEGLNTEKVSKQKVLDILQKPDGD